MSAEQVEGVRVSKATPIDVDLTDMEIVQLVHDLGNQLMVLTSNVNAIRDRVADGPADRLTELRHSAELTVLLIDTLLAEDRPQTSPRTCADLNEVARRTAATLSHVEDHAIRIRLDLWAEPLGVVAERGALERVLLNLLLNAYDAMPGGGVLTIETAIAQAGPAAVQNMPLRRYARVRITDTGCGMTAEVKDRLFDPFFTTKPNGTGLGLRSVAFTLRKLQGRISVESEPGQGTSVTVMLPLAARAFPASGRPRD